MAIIIQNIDKNPREKGEHLYELRINSRIICRFKHNREDSLSQCLTNAAAAVDDISKTSEERR